MTARVYRLSEATLEPSTGGRPRALLTREEPAELVAVRGLLCELRPGETRDPHGPLAWSPMDRPPTHTEPRQGALAQRIRVQKSADPSPVPKDAFAGAAPVSPGVEIDALIRELADAGGVDAAAVLTWLQRSGTVADGLPALCVAVADALAPEALRARWSSRGAALSTERRRQWGLDAVLYAARWWHGERPVCWAQGAACDGVAWGAGCREVAARCQRPETIRARGPRCRRCSALP